MIQERFISGDCEPASGSPDGVAVRIFVSKESGARGFSTGTATFRGNAELPYHVHGCSEVITLLSGEALVVVEGRGYRLNRLDCVHVPAGIAHAVRNREPDREMVAHWSFASAEPARTFVNAPPRFEDRGWGNPLGSDPEHVKRFAESEVYELSEGASFRDLFAKRFGSAGICGGHARFSKGASLPCHTHAYDESITILTGGATCLVQGARREMWGIQNAFVPRGKPHRFLNNGESDMEMLWVYAGDEPDRTVVDHRYCSGLLVWPDGLRP
jgi:quercetin dioxygenase-like cupin family protein